MKKLNHSFSLNHYRICLIKAIKEGYKFIPMRKHKENHRKVIMLRHDIDFDLKLAMNFAKIEHKLGIPATYFIRLHGNYNPNQYSNFKILNSLLNMGHEIGLHFESGFYKLFNQRGSLERDISIFQSMIGIKIKGFSYHEPNKTDPISLKKYKIYSAYSDEIMKRYKYISDSCGNWREGCMCEWIGKEPKLYILTHPIWWINKNPFENY